MQLEDVLFEGYKDSSGHLSLLSRYFDDDTERLQAVLTEYCVNRDNLTQLRIGAIYGLSDLARQSSQEANEILRVLTELINDPSEDPEIRAESFVAFAVAFPDEPLDAFRGTDIPRIDSYLSILENEQLAQGVVESVVRTSDVTNLEFFLDEDHPAYGNFLQELIGWGQEDLSVILEVFSPLARGTPSVGVSRTLFRVLENPGVMSKVQSDATNRKLFLNLAGLFMRVPDAVVSRWASTVLQALWEGCNIPEKPEEMSALLGQVANFRDTSSALTNEVSFDILMEALGAQGEQAQSVIQVSGTKGPETAAREIIENLLIRKPPVDVEQVATSLGIVTREIGLGKLDGAMIGVFNTPVAVINTDTFPTRRRFTLAHEIGHYVLEHGDVVEEIDLSSKDKKEIEANKFAAELLMPLSMVGAEVEQSLTKGRLLRLAEQFQVSPLAFAYRIIPHVASPQWIVVRYASGRTMVVVSSHAEFLGVNEWNYQNKSYSFEYLEGEGYKLLLYTLSDTEPNRDNWFYEEPDRSSW